MNELSVRLRTWVFSFGVLWIGPIEGAEPQKTVLQLQIENTVIKALQRSDIAKALVTFDIDRDVDSPEYFQIENFVELDLESLGTLKESLSKAEWADTPYYLAAGPEFAIFLLTEKDEIIVGLYSREQFGRENLVPLFASWEGKAIQLKGRMILNNVVWRDEKLHEKPTSVHLPGWVKTKAYRSIWSHYRSQKKPAQQDAAEQPATAGESK